MSFYKVFCNFLDIKVILFIKIYILSKQRGIIFCLNIMDIEGKNLAFVNIAVIKFVIAIILMLLIIEND